MTSARPRQAVAALCMLFASLAVEAGAQPARLNGNVITLPVVSIAGLSYHVELTLVEGSNPVALRVSKAIALHRADTDNASTFSDDTLSVPDIAVEGTRYWADFSLSSMDPPTFLLADAGVIGPAAAQQCTRPEPDPSHGDDTPQVVGGFIVPLEAIADGGPGPDGIPAIESPLFTQDFRALDMQDQELVIGVKIGDIVKAYPHRFLDYHEVVNDRFVLDGSKKDFSLSYCPLTGSATLWKAFEGTANKSFGVSGLLYNSNLIMYDRDSGSLWSQMLEQAISGPEVTRIPDKFQVLETNWFTWRSMYPETLVLMIEENDFSFPYDRYPYGTYRTDDNVIYEVSDLSDNRLHRKERVLGVNVGQASRVYPITHFDAEVTVINDRIGDMDVVATGSSSRNFAVVFNRQLEDCTTLAFTPLQDQLPLVMVDNEGSSWDVFGNAVAGPRAGTQLQKTNSYIAYWFAWAAFFPGAEIYQ